MKDISITVINKRRRSAVPRPPPQGDDENDDDDDDDDDKYIIPTFPPTGRTVAADATPRRARDEGYIDARGLGSMFNRPARRGLSEREREQRHTLVYYSLQFNRFEGKI
jgi:hypothetical protein